MADVGLIVALGGGGGGSPSQGAIKVGTITNSSTSFPSVRPNGTALHDEDYVVYSGTPPKTIGNITFTKSGEKAYYDTATNTWNLSSGVVVSSSEVLPNNTADESLSGSASSQSVINTEFATQLKKKLIVSITSGELSKTIQHNFGIQPTIICIDNNNEVVYGGITHIDENNVRIDFGNNFIGNIILKA